MAGDETIGEAVRQLGRAVGSLARALVGTVRRAHPAPRHEPESGPPQAWLDLVAETDPEWLARSRWADLASQDQPRRRRRPARTSRTRVTEPAPRRVGHEAKVEPDVRPTRDEGRRAATADRGTTRADETPTRLPAAPTIAQRAGEARPVEPALPERPVRRTGHQPARLVPVERSTEHLENETPAEAPVPPTSRLLPTPSPLGDLTPSTAWNPPHELRHVGDVEPEPVPYEPSAPRPAARLEAPEVPAAREHTRPRSYSPLAEHVRELPGTWQSRPAPEPHRPTRRPQPAAASAPTWPELPPTEGLDEQAIHPAPGLAAVLWELDGRPDTLTTAQRRS